ncbi:alpha/beta-hydrolase [Mycena floridula]|nr:alpha/beta-hydrolase [Mycena floridula]
MSSVKAGLKIPSATPNWDLDAWSYTPSLAGPHPVIVMAHGWSANKLMSLAEYAEAFATLGYACVVFDYRRWGASDGTPRHLLVVKEQLEDYRTVIKYVRQQSHLDPQRVVVWGSSFAGGHAITLASEPSVNVVAAIAQCPYTGVTPVALNLTTFKTMFYAITDALKQLFGLPPLYIMAATGPGRVGGLTAPGSEEGLLAICKKSQLTSLCSRASFIRCPLILIAPEDDTLCLLSGAQTVVGSAEHGEILAIPQSGHFDVYPSFPHHEISLNKQIDFLKRHVPL